eukprot:6151727-Pyramimonas_sp.AAC.1
MSSLKPSGSLWRPLGWAGGARGVKDCLDVLVQLLLILFPPRPDNCAAGNERLVQRRDVLAPIAQDRVSWIELDISHGVMRDLGTLRQLHRIASRRTEGGAEV